MSKKIKKCLWIVLSILCIGVLAFQFFVPTYKADQSVLPLLEEVKETKDTIEIGSNQGKTLFIFYPGANVEPESYIPLLQPLKKEQIDSIIIKMPLNLAILGWKKAEIVIENKKEQYDSIYLVGHSLGGAMASQYASKHKDEIDGLILLGAYPYKQYPVEKTLCIYGSEGAIEGRNKEKIIKVEDLKYRYEIQGGNHAQFGNYGVQKGDGVGIITHEEQQKQTRNYILNFLKENREK